MGKRMRDWITISGVSCSRRSPRSGGPNRQICWQEITKTGQGGGRSGKNHSVLTISGFRIRLRVVLGLALAARILIGFRLSTFRGCTKNNWCGWGRNPPSLLADISSCHAKLSG